MAKDSLFDAFASVAQALGSGRRAEIVDVLAQGERSVDEVASEIGQFAGQYIASSAACWLTPGLVRSRREGARVVYRLASERVAELWAAVRDVAVRHVAVVSVLSRRILGRPWRCGAGVSGGAGGATRTRRGRRAGRSTRARIPGRSHRRCAFSASG